MSELVNKTGLNEGIVQSRVLMKSRCKEIKLWFISLL